AFVGGDRARIDRWGAYGLTHFERWSFLGELVSGTDKINSATGAKSARNVLAAFGEANFQASRGVNFRARVDHMETDRAADLAVRKLSSFNRYAVEGEIVPVPFCELRWTLRMIDPAADKNAAGVKLDSENQAYLQVHFAF